jgi:hypothetical protein
MSDSTLHHDRIDAAQEMTRKNTPFEVEQIEQLALIARLPTHHGKPPPLAAENLAPQFIIFSLIWRHR